MIFGLFSDYLKTSALEIGFPWDQLVAGWGAVYSNSFGFEFVIFAKYKFPTKLAFFYVSILIF